MGSNIFTNFEERSDDPLNIVLLLGFTKTLLILSILAITGVQQASMALIVVPLVFLPLFVSAYFVTEGNIFTSDFSNSAEAAAYTFGLAAALVPARGIGIDELSFFSLATDPGAYLSVLSQLDPLTQDTVNISLVTWGENYGLIPLGGLLYIMWGEFFEYTNRFQSLNRASVKMLLSAVPIGIFFALLHGARTLSFVMFAASVMIIWVVAVGYESETESRLVGIVPLSIIATVGYHVGHNILASGGTLFGYIGDLFAADQAFQMIGAIELGWHLLVFGLTVNWFYMKVQKYT